MSSPADPRPDRPEWQRQDHDPERDLGYYAAKAGTMTLGEDMLPPGMPALRASRGIARTFQTPRVIGEASVLQNS